MSKLPSTQPRRAMDPEIQAMCRADRLLAELPDDAAWRVLSWLMSKYQTRPQPCSAGGSVFRQPSQDMEDR